MYFVLNACFQHMTEAGGEYHHPHPYSMAQQYTGAPIQYNSPVAAYPEYEVVQPPLYPPSASTTPPPPPSTTPRPSTCPRGTWTPPWAAGCSRYSMSPTTTTTQYQQRLSTG